MQSQPDVGADLSGKVIGVGGQKLDEDSPFNPGTQFTGSAGTKVSQFTCSTVQKLDEDSPFNPGTLSLLAVLVQKYQY